MRPNSSTGEARTRRRDQSRVSRWLRPILQVPLEAKLLGANLIIVGVALLLMFGPVPVYPSRVIDAYIVVAALMVAAAVNAWLVRVALAPLKSIEQVAKWVSQGRLGERVPTSPIADRELERVSKTINRMLDSLVADRKRIEQLAAELATKEEQRSARDSRFPPPADGIVRSVVNAPLER